MMNDSWKKVKLKTFGVSEMASGNKGRWNELKRISSTGENATTNNQRSERVIHSGRRTVIIKPHLSLSFPSSSFYVQIIPLWLKGHRHPYGWHIMDRWDNHLLKNPMKQIEIGVLDNQFKSLKLMRWKI